MTRTLLLALACATTLACGNDSANEAVGNLTVRVTTTGTADPNGYVLSVEGQSDRAMSSTDTTYFFDLPIDTYDVHLAGAEIGCTVVDGADRAKYVAVGNNDLIYSVTCP